MTTLPLTSTQHAILVHAIEHGRGKIDWFPDNIKGGARKKVLDGLSKRALIARDGGGWVVAPEGYDALGRARPEPAPEAESSRQAAPEPTTTKPRGRKNSKQANVIWMLQRPEGATVRQICEATGWQAHTVRGTFAGALKKKLGLTLVSEKAKDGERVYRIA